MMIPLNWLSFVQIYQHCNTISQYLTGCFIDIVTYFEPDTPTQRQIHINNSSVSLCTVVPISKLLDRRLSIFDKWWVCGDWI